MRRASSPGRPNIETGREASGSGPARVSRCKTTFSPRRPPGRRLETAPYSTDTAIRSITTNRWTIASMRSRPTACAPPTHGIRSRRSNPNGRRSRRTKFRRPEHASSKSTRPGRFPSSSAGNCNRGDTTTRRSSPDTRSRGRRHSSTTGKRAGVSVSTVPKRVCPSDCTPCRTAAPSD